jgi:hypothetical protein
MKIRTFFFRRNLRERILLLVVVGAVLAVWLSSLTSRIRNTARNWSELGQNLEMQQIWLDSAPKNAEEMKTRLNQLKQGLSLNSTQLVGQLDAVLKRQGVKYRLDPPTTERRPPVAINSVSLSLEKAELSAVGAFVDELGKSLPLVNIEQIVITPDRRLPSQLDVRFKLSGFELLPEAGR